MSIAALPEFSLDPGRVLGGRCALRGLRSFHAVAEHVWNLPYGRTSDPADYAAVLAEQRGTCSTKHALLAALAREHDEPLRLMLGIYEMTEQNTPGVGAALRRHGFSSVLEAHCYLQVGSTRVDLTRTGVAAEPISHFIHEEQIAPEQIGIYKNHVHHSELSRWARHRDLPFDTALRVREACIAALSGSPAP